MEATLPREGLEGNDHTKGDNIKLLFGTELDPLLHTNHNEWYSYLAKVCIFADGERIIQHHTILPERTDPRNHTKRTSAARSLDTVRGQLPIDFLNNTPANIIKEISQFFDESSDAMPLRVGSEATSIQLKPG